MIYEFSPATFEILQQNGWTPDRRVDIAAYKAYFAQTSQPTSDIIFDFLASFGGLEFTFPLKARPLINISFIIDPIDSGEGTGMEELDWYATEWVQKPLCAVGWYSGPDTLAMTPDGEFYRFFDSWVYRLGNSVVEAIENLVTQTGGEQISKKQS